MREKNVACQTAREAGIWHDYTSRVAAWLFFEQLLDQTRSALTTLHRSRSRGTHKIKPGGQADSERSSATVCDSTGAQCSISTGISAGQAPRNVRSSSIVVGRYRISFSEARHYGKLRGSRGSDPRLVRLTMNRLLDCTSQERPSTSSFVCVAKVRPNYVTITRPGSIDPCQVKRRARDLDGINRWIQLLTMCVGTCFRCKIADENG